MTLAVAISKLIDFVIDVVTDVDAGIMESATSIDQSFKVACGSF